MKIFSFLVLCLLMIQPQNLKSHPVTLAGRAEALQDSILIPPAFLRCGDGKQGYGLYWIDKSTDETKFRIYRAVNSAMVFTFFVDVISKSGATPGTQYFYKIQDAPENFYTYKVTSVGRTGEGDPSNLAFIPRRPTGLSGKSDSISVTLDWTYPDDHWIRLIFVERSNYPDRDFKIMAPVVSENGVKFIDYSVDKKVDYYYRIRGAFYQNNRGVTCYTLPTNPIGPYKVPGVGKDYDGEITYQGRNYKYKTFGKQTWLTENLAYLPEVYPAASVSVSDNRYYVYGYQGASVADARKNENYKTYGVLYNWTAATGGIVINPSDPIGVQGICPDGWHLPGNPEWTELNYALDRIRATRDSLIRIDAQKKGVKGVQIIQFEGDFAMPDFKEFGGLPGGYLRSDSNKFATIGGTENYWSSTNRIETDKGIHPSDAGKGFAFSVRCIKGAALPTVVTADIADLAETAVTAGGTVTHSGGAPVTTRGICWYAVDIPTDINNPTTGGSGMGPYNCAITSLAPGTFYVLRAYATNSAGTGYGEPKQFITKGKGALPSVSTGDISEITGASAAVGGYLTAYGGAPVTDRGICFSLTKNPTIKDSIARDRAGKPSFTGYLPELKANTTYFIKSYATNSIGTSYGEERKFTTQEKGLEGVLDYQGRKYKYKTIGTQTWMTENLAYLPAVSPATAGAKDTPYYYVHYFDGSNPDTAKSSGYYKKYGVLYNWAAAKTACPSGWHLPTDKEFGQLTEYLTNYGYSFGESGSSIAKSMSATAGWDSLDIPGSIGYNQRTNNRSGFNVLPAGQRTVPRNGMVSNVRKAATFWTSTEFKQEMSYAYALVLFYSQDVVTIYPNTDKRNGNSVRCIKDR
jgi:uncharacterized protein (TIGR02145 family)